MEPVPAWISDWAVTDRPVVTGRPAGPVQSGRLRPVPVFKKPDRFHLCMKLLHYLQSIFFSTLENKTTKLWNRYNG